MKSPVLRSAQADTSRSQQSSVFISKKSSILPFDKCLIPGGILGGFKNLPFSHWDWLSLPGKNCCVALSGWLVLCTIASILNSDVEGILLPVKLSTSNSPLLKLKVLELKEILRKNGCKVGGNKTLLIERIKMEKNNKKENWIE